MNDFLFSLTAVAGISQEIPARGDCVAYYEETGGGADQAVVIHAIGGSGGDFVLRPGEQVKLAQVADGFRVENKNGANAIAGSLKIGVGEFTGKNVAGAVAVSNFPAGVYGGAVVADGAVNVTNASAVIVAANAARRYLMVQNKHATGRVYLKFGATATAANGIRLEPGQAWEFHAYQSTAALHAIGDIALNADVVILEI